MDALLCKDGSSEFQKRCSLVRQLLLSQDKDAGDLRSAWRFNGTNASYEAYRRYLSSLPRDAPCAQNYESGLKHMASPSLSFRSPLVCKQDEVQEPKALPGTNGTFTPTSGSENPTNLDNNNDNIKSDNASRTSESPSSSPSSSHRPTSETGRFTSADLANLPFTAKYSFDGLSGVVEESRGSTITVAAFAPLCTDLFVFANVDGAIWIVDLESMNEHFGAVRQVVQLPPAHRSTVVSLDWSFDASQLLSVSLDGSLAVWATLRSVEAKERGMGRERKGRVDSDRTTTTKEGEDGKETRGGSKSRKSIPVCIRTIKNARAGFHSGRFHPANPSLVVIGTSLGVVEVYNCSSGLLLTRCSVFGIFEKALPLTALDCNLHHIFVGDSAGCLHLLALHYVSSSDVDFRLTLGRHRLRLSSHLASLTPCSLTTSSFSSSTTSFPITTTTTTSTTTPIQAVEGWTMGSVMRIEHVPYCRMTGSAVLAATLRDGAICIVRLKEAQHVMEIHLKRQTPSHALWTSSTICPLSGIQDSPLFTCGAHDGTVSIFDPSIQGIVRPTVLSASSDIRYGNNNYRNHHHQPPVATGTVGLGLGLGSVALGAFNAALPPPSTVVVLRQHRAAATAVAWSFDEMALVSGDAEGQILIWKRTKLL